MDVLWLIGLSLSASLPAPSEPEPSAIHSTLSDLPLTFESNQGQTDALGFFCHEVLTRRQAYRVG